MAEIEIVNSNEDSEMNETNTIKCLDKGFVRLVDCMGDDGAVVQAARVSYGKGTKNKRRDAGLINYLLKHQHNSPFEMVEFKFHCKMPIFVARQWVRHRTANINEISGRYSIMEETVWEPTSADLRQQSQVNRQGSIEEAVPEPANSEILKTYRDDVKKAFEHYNFFLEKGVAREIARTNLPISLYTEWYWKIDLHNLLHFLELRMAPHAQKEIRIYANAMAHFVKEKCPISWDAFEEHRLNGMHISRSEMEVLKKVIEENNLTESILNQRAKQLKAQDASDALIKVELAELEAKLTGKTYE